MKLSKQRITIIALTLFLVLVLPLSVYLVTQRQELRKKATGGVCTNYSFSLPTSTPTGLKVFVTSLTYNGNLGGLTGADAKCQALAASANLANANNFKAWLSDSTTNAKDRFITKDKPYYRIDNVKVANNFADLIDGTLLNPINKNESGITVTTSVYVWTGTDRYGVKKTANQNFCYNWSSTSNKGYTGLSSTTSYSWTDSTAYYACNTVLRLYCLEDASTSPIPTLALSPTPTAIPSAPPMPTLAPSPTPSPTLTPTPSLTVTPTPVLTPTSAPAISLKVFVTSIAYPGNIAGSFGTGLSAADAKCQERAAAANRTGTFKAWLSTNGVYAKDRFMTTDKPYVLVNGTQVADNLADLVDSSLDHQIDIDERGLAVASSSVWTGTKSSGFGSSYHCTNWTTISSSYRGVIGRTNYTNSAWTSYSSLTCNGTARLYCFQD